MSVAHGYDCSLTYGTFYSVRVILLAHACSFSLESDTEDGAVKARCNSRCEVSGRYCSHISTAMSCHLVAVVHCIKSVVLCGIDRN